MEAELMTEAQGWFIVVELAIIAVAHLRSFFK